MFIDMILRKVGLFGGFHNAHAHLDRAGTFIGCMNSRHALLSKKHGLIATLHESGWFDPAALERRAAGYIERLIRTGTRRVDTTADIDPAGKCPSMDVLHGLKQVFADRIDIRVGAYMPYGFPERDDGRWELFRSIAAVADFIAWLPERDDRRMYPGHIGFRESCRRAVALAMEFDKPVQIHADQSNDPRSGETAVILDVLADFGMLRHTPGPMVWIVHCISPSCYPDSRFAALLQRMAPLRVGVICCPSAALSMIAPRRIWAPIHNSIARVPDFVSAGIPVRLGSDNIEDVFSPATSGDMREELKILADALRWYDVEALSALAAVDPENRT